MQKTSMMVRVAGFSACGVLLCSGLWGCGDRSEAAQATRDASLELDQIAAGGTMASYPEFTSERFEKANALLNRTSLDGTDSEKAGVVILNSWSAMGRASSDDHALSTLETEAVARMAAIRTQLRGWEQYHSLAAANEAVDPSQEVATLDQERAVIEAGIQQATSAKNDVDKRVSELESQINKLAEEARVERAEAAKLELRAAQMTAVQAAELAPQIQVHALAADKKLLESARVQAKADQLGTESTEATLTFEMLKEQKSLNEKAKADILAARDEALANAAQLRGEASESAAQIKALVDDLMAFRQGKDAAGSLDQIFETQIDRLRTALGQARQGVTEMRTEGKIAMGAANAALGDALTQKARSYADLGALLTRLAEASPALPDRSTYEQMAAEASRVSAEATGEAVNAFEAAAEDYAGTNAKGAEARDLLDALVGRLRARAGQAGATEPGDVPVEDGGDAAQEPSGN